MAGHEADAGRNSSGTIISAATSNPTTSPTTPPGQDRRRLLPELGLEAVYGLEREATEDAAHHVADAGAEEDEQEGAARACGAGGLPDPAADGRDQGDEDEADASGDAPADVAASTPLLVLRHDAHPASESPIEGPMAPPLRVIGACRTPPEFLLGTARRFRQA